MNTPRFVTRVGLAVLLLSACKSDEQTWVRGRQVACPCPDGADSVQVCNDDGTGFEACQCDSPSMRDQVDAAAEADSGQSGAVGGSGRAGTTGTGGSAGGTGSSGSAAGGRDGGAIEAGTSGGVVRSRQPCNSHWGKIIRPA